MNEPKPTVSVVIPCHNYGRFLATAIGSALAQTEPPCQIIVVDDGSTDNTREVAQCYKDSIYYLALPHSGVCRARNEGLLRAAGDFVIFLDADDALIPSYIEKTLAAWLLAPNPKPAFVYTQRCDFDSSTALSRYSPFDPTLLKFKNYIMISALLRTEIVREEEFDPTFASGLEDYDFFLSLVEKGHTGLLLDQPLLRVRAHESSRNRACRAPTLCWPIMLQLLRKHGIQYSLRDRHRFMSDLKMFVANRIKEQRQPTQPTSARLAALMQMIRYRAPVLDILSQLFFIIHRPLPAIPSQSKVDDSCHL